MARTLVRWDPLRELAQWQNDFGRLLSVALREGATNGVQRWVPALDAWETENEIVYAFDLPGIPQDTISIEFENGALTVSAERERSQEVSQDRFYRFERRYGSFSPTIGLPEGLEEKDINADYKDGVLEIHVAKPKAPEPRRITIGGGSGRETIEGKAS
jgi:HSP20 family protein